MRTQVYRVTSLRLSKREVGALDGRPSIAASEHRDLDRDRHGPHLGRGKQPEAVIGTGEDDAGALRDLTARLEAIPQPDGSRMDALRARIRFTWRCRS